MTNLTEIKEPYVRVNERIVSSSVNPTAGEDLIIGCAIISDCGPGTPTLISSQKEFLEAFSSQDITSEYVQGMNSLYKGDDSTLASTMWLNAYRLAGSNSLLCVRASKAKDINFAKALVDSDNNTYILRDGQLLKSVPSFKLVISKDVDEADHNINGWSLAANGVGVIGNRNTDEGVAYDYYVGNLEELAKYLNDTSKFFSPEYKLYSDSRATVEATSADEAISIVFEEVYLGKDFLDILDERCTNGLGYLVACEPTWSEDTPTQSVVELNESTYSNFVQPSEYAINQYNTSTDLKVRIRRFNHDAVISKSVTTPDANADGVSPYTVIEKVLDTYTAAGTKVPSDSIIYRDFYEIAVMDPSISSEALYFNVGNILGRGDMSIDSVNESLKMVQLTLPSDLADLGLDYFKEGSSEELTADLSINPENHSILDVSDSDILKAFDQISDNEIYTVEGLTDLGCTVPAVQSYLANMAINENYFYPISTVNSTNYLTIASSISRISQDSTKLYASAPWDVDSGTLGIKFYASPSVLYWETVGRNKGLAREFAPSFGQINGIAKFQRPVVEFNKSVRQLLLSKQINTVLWDTVTSSYNWNDNYTKSSEDSIMRDDGNSRLNIRISKSIPTLLSRFKGRRINSALWKDASDVLDYWFRNAIIPMSYTIDSYRITINETNNPEEIQQQNKMQVLVEVRYQRALKYVEVYNQAYDTGLDFSGQIIG